MKRIIAFALATVLFAVPALAIRAVDVQEGMNNEEFKALLSLLIRWFSDSDPPKEPGVLYRDQVGRENRLYLSSFAQWCKEEEAAI